MLTLPAYDAKAINVSAANKNYNIIVITGPYIVFEVEYLRNGRNKKDGGNANVVLWVWPNFRYSVNFASSSRIGKTSQDY